MATPRQFTGSLWEMVYLVRWFIKDGDFPVRKPLRWPVVLTTEIQDLAELTKTVWDWIVDGHMFRTFYSFDAWNITLPKSPEVLRHPTPGYNRLYTFFMGVAGLLTEMILQPSAAPSTHQLPRSIQTRNGALGVPCHGPAQSQSSLSWVHPDRYSQIDFKIVQISNILVSDGIWYLKIVRLISNIFQHHHPTYYSIWWYLSISIQRIQPIWLGRFL